jgi:hypothetical protein
MHVVLETADLRGESAHGVDELCLLRGRLL